MKLKIFFVSLLFLIFTTLAFLNPWGVVTAQNVNCTSNKITNGLLVTPDFQSPTHLGNPNGQCVINNNPGTPDSKAGFASFTIPTYSELKNLYFNRKTTVTGSIEKSTLTGNQTNLDLTQGCSTCQKIINITGNLSLTANPTGNAENTALVFIDGDLNIGDLNISNNFPSSTAPNLDITYADVGATARGIVYLVGGNVNFGRNAHNFDGIVIAQGTICTSYDNICTPDAHSFSDPGGETKQLTINGSLVSLDQAHPISFERNLSLDSTNNSSAPAEAVVAQPKYFIILRNLLSTTFNMQTEDSHYAVNQ